MPEIKELFLHVEQILLAHEHLSLRGHKCEYRGRRESYGMVFVLEGEAEYRFSDGERCRVSEGDAILLSADTAYVLTPHTPFRHYTVNFTVEEEKSYFPLAPPGFLRLSVKDEGFRRIFSSLISLQGRRRAEDEMARRGHLYSLLSLFVSYMTEYTQTEKDIRLMPAKRYIEENCCGEVSLTLLSTLCHMSVTAFRRCWLSAYGETAMHYKDRLRLARAEEFLYAGHFSVSETAELCGFEDVSYFVKFFKRMTGVTPGHFKGKL